MYGDFAVQFSVYTKLSHTPRILSLGSLWEELDLNTKWRLDYTAQHRETSRVFLDLADFWPEFYLQMGKSFNISFNFMFFHDSRRPESIRVDPSSSDSDWQSELIQSDFCTCLLARLFCTLSFAQSRKMLSKFSKLSTILKHRAKNLLTMTSIVQLFSDRS